MRIALIWCLLVGIAAAQDVVRDVRAAVAQNNLALAESLIQKHKAAQGTTPQLILAVTWLGRGALAAKQLDRAELYAVEAHKLAIDQLTHRKLDDDPILPLALGASIELQALAMSGRGARDEAVTFLRGELKTYRETSIRTRIQKNIHLLSLEGKPAPALDVSRWLGPKPLPLAQLRGRPLLLFFWAHWCSDCKNLLPDLVRLAAEFGPKGLLIIGPTQHYGYVGGGVEASPEQEIAYIDSVRKEFYSSLASMPVPVSEENFKNYGSSSSPTLVLVDRKGIVRVYHPGSMSYGELVAGVQSMLGD